MSQAKILLVSLSTALTLTASLLVAAPAGAQPAPQNHPKASTGQGGTTAGQAAQAFAAGNYTQARTLAYRHDDPASLLIRARLAVFDGDLELATRFARAAFDHAVKPQQKALASAALARLLTARGQWDAAEKGLRAFLSSHPKAFAVRLELGRLLNKRGARTEARTVLEPFSEYFNNGLLKTPRQLRWLGEAMREVDSFDDANYAFQKMYDQDPGYVDGLVSWAELLLSKYNTADAERTLREALAINPHNPRALVDMARLEMQTKNYFDDARADLDKAAEVAAHDPRLVLTRAELDIYDNDCAKATRRADAILKKRTRFLDAFVIKAACRYLQDDHEGFERIGKKALALDPDFAKLYTETARYANLSHRYVEVVELEKKALALRPGYPPALLGLGIGLSRIGKEDRAVPYLKKAFDKDPYNVRAYNMVELYDKTMPNYDLTAYGKFTLRTQKSQTAALNQMVPKLVKQAMATYEKKYHFKARAGLQVEIYPNHSTFGVRSVGLPHISPTGLCFGRIVITRSPSDGNFNWRQVIWHEMAHVYHIQKSNYRVPRWFTEGLAEYETNVKDPAWERHRDREIVAMMRQGDLPSVVDLDKRFTQARSYKGILRAYNLSSLVIHFIVEEHGFEAINKMLDEFPKKLDTAKVIEAALGEDVPTFDKKLRAWLEKRYANFHNQFVVSLDQIPPVRTLDKKLSDKPNDAVLRAKLGVAQLRDGHPKKADEAIERALTLDKHDPTVQYLAAVVALNEGRARDAYKHGMAILDAFKDGYEIRVVLGRTAMMLEKPKAARVHLEAATQLYPDGTEAWVNLYKLAQSQHDAKLEATAERRLFELDQNDPLIARQRLKRMLAQKQWDKAMQAAERWVAIQPLEARAQRALAQASLQSKHPDRAVDAYEVLVDLLPDTKQQVRREAADALRKAGYSKRAQRFSKLASDDAK